MIPCPNSVEAKLKDVTSKFPRKSPFPFLDTLHIFPALSFDQDAIEREFATFLYTGQNATLCAVLIISIVLNLSMTGLIGATGWILVFLIVTGLTAAAILMVHLSLLCLERNPPPDGNVASSWWQRWRWSPSPKGGSETNRYEMIAVTASITMVALCCFWYRNAARCSALNIHNVAPTVSDCCVNLPWPTPYGVAMAITLILTLRSQFTVLIVPLTIPATALGRLEYMGRFDTGETVGMSAAALGAFIVVICVLTIRREERARSRFEVLVAAHAQRKLASDSLRELDKALAMIVHPGVLRHHEARREGLYDGAHDAVDVAELAAVGIIDIADFAKWSTLQPPHILCLELGRMINLLDELLDHHVGVEKLIGVGDTYIVTCGLCESLFIRYGADTHSYAQSTARFLLDAFRVFRHFVASLPPNDATWKHLALRFVVAAGPLAGGPLSDELPLAYGVHGYAMDAARVMVERAEPWRVMADATAASLMAPPAVFVSNTSVQLLPHNIDTPVTCGSPASLQAGMLQQTVLLSLKDCREIADRPFRGSSSSATAAAMSSLSSRTSSCGSCTDPHRSDPVGVEQDGVTKKEGDEDRTAATWTRPRRVSSLQIVRSPPPPVAGPLATPFGTRHGENPLSPPRVQLPMAGVHVEGGTSAQRSQMERSSSRRYGFARNLFATRHGGVRLSGTRAPRPPPITTASNSRFGSDADSFAAASPSSIESTPTFAAPGSPSHLQPYHNNSDRQHGAISSGISRGSSTVMGHDDAPSHQNHHQQRAERVLNRFLLRLLRPFAGSAMAAWPSDTETAQDVPRRSDFIYLLKAVEATSLESSSTWHDDTDSPHDIDNDDIDGCHPSAHTQQQHELATSLRKWMRELLFGRPFVSPDAQQALEATARAVAATNTALISAAAVLWCLFYAIHIADIMAVHKRLRDGSISTHPLVTITQLLSTPSPWCALSSLLLLVGLMLVVRSRLIPRWLFQRGISTCSSDARQTMQFLSKSLAVEYRTALAFWQLVMVLQYAALASSPIGLMNSNIQYLFFAHVTWLSLTVVVVPWYGGALIILNAIYEMIALYFIIGRDWNEYISLTFGPVIVVTAVGGLVFVSQQAQRERQRFTVAVITAASLQLRSDELRLHGFVQEELVPAPLRNDYMKRYRAAMALHSTSLLMMAATPRVGTSGAPPISLCGSPRNLFGWNDVVVVEVLVTRRYTSSATTRTTAVGDESSAVFNSSGHAFHGSDTRDFMQHSCVAIRHVIKLLDGIAATIAASSTPSTATASQSPPQQQQPLARCSVQGDRLQFAGPLVPEGVSETDEKLRCALLAAAMLLHAIKKENVNKEMPNDVQFSAIAACGPLMGAFLGSRIVSFRLFGHTAIVCTSGLQAAPGGFVGATAAFLRGMSDHQVVVNGNSDCAFGPLESWAVRGVGVIQVAPVTVV